MALVHEYLGYNRFGLRCVTAKEMRERKERVLKHEFSPKKDIQKQSKNGKAIEWFCIFLALTIANQKAKERLFKNTSILKKIARGKNAHVR